MATIFLSKSRCPSVASLDARMNLWQPRRKNRFFSSSSSDFLLLLRSWSHSWLSFRRLGALSVASLPRIQTQPCTSLAVQKKKAWIYRSCLKRWMQPDMIFVKISTRPAFLGQKFYTKKCVNCGIAKFTTNQRKCFKMPLLLALVGH